MTVPLIAMIVSFVLVLLMLYGIALGIDVVVARLQEIEKLLQKILDHSSYGQSAKPPTIESWGAVAKPEFVSSAIFSSSSIRLNSITLRLHSASLHSSREALI